ncbi:LAMI_0H04016g1_1 [Lachancea mirantina]|uniref:LAMI_0H04016g1_1 n=1 Tax=Lachancea mirantina TaxID=1230905 RepID=A0A1G4KEG0_9SACH|nr:LAMI_0H04016g1_1 [Lachancea mirantina]
MVKKIEWSDIGANAGSPILSPAVVTSKSDNLVFTSGCVGTDPTTDALPEDLEQQTRNAILNLRNVLAASGSSLDHVVKVLLFVSDSAHAKIVNKVYQEFFPGKPARSCIVVAFPNTALKIELECVAEVPAKRRWLKL